MRRTYLCLAMLGLTSTPIIGCAQGATRAVVRVHITDSTRAPLADVDVAVIRNDTVAIVLGRTDAAGRFTIALQPESASYKLAVRKLGYAQNARRLAIAVGDTLSIEISLARLPPELDTVRVTVKQLPRNKQPYIGADEIARDTRGIFDLRDVLHKLRPDIGYQSDRCPSGHTHFLVNGEPMWGSTTSIKSEHIAEVRYVNCFDRSIPGLPVRSWPSIYIVLKPGYAWEYKRGSYPVHPDSG